MMMDDGDKLFLTAQTLSAKVDFHKGRVKQQSIKSLKIVRNDHANIIKILYRYTAFLSKFDSIWFLFCLECVVKDNTGLLYHAWSQYESGMESPNSTMQI